MKTALIRWVIFIFVGLPIQLLVYIIYPFLHLIWRMFVYKHQPTQQIPQHDNIYKPEGTATRANGDLLDNIDDHGAFTMYGFIGPAGISKLVDANGNLLRRYEDDGNHNMWSVSGDVVIAWAFANLFIKSTPEHDALIYKVAMNYLKHLGTLSYDRINKGDVSSRCNNFGVNYCPDSTVLKIGQPSAGPQFYTSSSLFALASRKSKFFTVIFWIHWVLMGGWYWAFSPILYTKNHPLDYVKDMTMKALFIHQQIFSNRWWIKKPMEIITYKLTTHRNDLFYAMLGKNPGPLPEVMDSFFSQQPDATSRRSDRMSAYIADTILLIKDMAQQKIQNTN